MRDTDKTKEQLVTELAAARQALEAERRRADELVDKAFVASPIGVFISKDRKFKLVNEEFEKISGYTKSELLAMEPASLVLPDDRDTFRRNAIAMLKGERSSPFEFRSTRKDGEVRWVLEKLASIQYQGGRAALGNYVDITELKQVEAALRQSQEKFEAFMNSATDGVILYDSKLNYVDINKAGLERLGKKKEEIIRKNLLDLRPEVKKTDRYKKYLEVMKTGKPVVIEEAVVNYPKSGAVILQMRVFKVGDGIGIISTDITERKKMEEELRQHHDNLAKLVQERTAELERQSKIAQRQAQEILEISTPVMQVWDGVLVAPLIGTLDSQRTQQFMERLLERIVETNSPVTLLDITGVPAIDTQTAQHLIDTISAVRLLGAQVILTGVRPAIAQTLVHLGIDLEGITTRSSLSAGLSVAISNLGLTVTTRKTTEKER